MKAQLSPFSARQSDLYFIFLRAEIWVGKNWEHMVEIGLALTQFFRITGDSASHFGVSNWCLLSTEHIG